MDIKTFLYIVVMIQSGLLLLALPYVFPSLGFTQSGKTSQFWLENGFIQSRTSLSSEEIRLLGNTTKRYEPSNAVKDETAFLLRQPEEPTSFEVADLDDLRKVIGLRNEVLSLCYKIRPSAENVVRSPRKKGVE